MRFISFLGFIILCPSIVAAAAETESKKWQDIVEQAKGQTVHWHAWGGSPTINSYIAWVRDEVKREYGINLQHVKVKDTAHVVSQVLAAKVAGKHTQGSVDMVWINGENFKAMKQNNLLFGPFANQLPNFVFVDTENKPTTLVDFTVPTDGYESPWGMAHLNFIYDSAQMKIPPTSVTEILAYAKKNPGRLSYPAPPDFMGSTFLKQVFYEVIPDTDVLQKPPTAENREPNIKILLNYLDALNPHLWQKGKNYPKDSTHLERLLGDNEVDIAISFNPGHASEAILDGRLPDTVRTFVMKGGSLGNTHFVAIPYNAKSQGAAQVVANFLISPEAQLRKSDPRIWGDPTVLDVDKLPSRYQKSFAMLPLGPATLSPKQLGKVLPEPHPDWMEAVERVWLERYAN